jgi:hypothetical protein
LHASFHHNSRQSLFLEKRTCRLQIKNDWHRKIVLCRGRQAFGCLLWNVERQSLKRARMSAAIAAWRLNIIRTSMHEWRSVTLIRLDRRIKLERSLRLLQQRNLRASFVTWLDYSRMRYEMKSKVMELVFCPSVGIRYANLELTELLGSMTKMCECMTNPSLTFLPDELNTCITLRRPLSIRFFSSGGLCTYVKLSSKPPPPHLFQQNSNGTRDMVRAATLIALHGFMSESLMLFKLEKMSPCLATHEHSLPFIIYMISRII